MRKLIMWNLMGLDGRFEGPGHDISWMADAWSEDLEAISIQQGEAMGGMVFGRRTHDLMAGYWPGAADGPEANVAHFMNTLPKYVFSRSIKHSDWANVTMFNSDPVAEIARLKAEGGKNLYLFGSAQLARPLIEADLFDEYRIGVAPLLHGEGVPLFKEWMGRRKLSLLEARPMKNDVVLLRYARVR
ncbi:MAG: dihydrofolate reductase family protein [Oceanicaulis sp.]|uniref:dihydrofolate reductase family protein n=1 Tax=Glycocaulis sp. TaxID=1969725 RepID=UPI0025B81BCC|nr:dihydrofolate reductase family protein [Glycocaulis sp.]MCC5980301.1 dihydrofolate reductase family protein [Oceanicaulis sp.]MCH8521679.1 dihydrofolate reductase family protein [Glycocaulis sp.]